MAVPADAEQTLLQFAIRRELRRGNDAIDAAIDHDGHVLGDFRRHADILLDHQHRNVGLLRKPDQHVLDLRYDHRREPFGRLIHDQQPRIEQECARDREHLLFAARQLPCAVAFAFRKAWERVVDASDRPQAALGCHEAQMLVDRERAPQATPLRHVADADPRDVGGRAPDQLLAGDADRAAGGPHQTHDRLAQSGLAHAVAADHRQDTALQGQIDALQCVRVPVVNVEPRHFEHRRGGHAGCGAFTHVRLHARRRDRAPGLPDRIRFPPAALL